jgi:hypothetical protein
MQALTTSNVPVAMKDDNVEVRMTEVGDMTASIIRLAKGTDLAPALVGLPDDRCPCPHWGYMLEGRLLMHTREGDQTYEAGQAFYWAPGHSPTFEVPQRPDCADRLLSWRAAGRAASRPGTGSSAADRCR